LLWWDDDSPRLSSSHRAVLEDGSNEVFLSTVSVWEATIKHSQGRLPLPGDPLHFFQKAVEDNGFLVLPVYLKHAAGVHDLPKLHTDPFDRLLIAQARSEGLVILSSDAVFANYDLPGLVR